MVKVVKVISYSGMLIIYWGGIVDRKLKME